MDVLKKDEEEINLSKVFDNNNNDSEEEEEP